MEYDSNESIPDIYNPVPNLSSSLNFLEKLYHKMLKRSKAAKKETHGWLHGQNATPLFFFKKKGQ